MSQSQLREMILSEKPPCKLIVSGQFTPYDPGVRYHRDGSGTPPDGPYFEPSIVTVEGDAGPMLSIVHEHYCTHLRRMREALIDDVKAHITDQAIAEQVLKLINWKIKTDFPEYIDQILDTMADEIEKNYQDELYREEQEMEFYNPDNDNY